MVDSGHVLGSAFTALWHGAAAFGLTGLVGSVGVPAVPAPERHAAGSPAGRIERRAAPRSSWWCFPFAVFPAAGAPTSRAGPPGAVRATLAAPAAPAAPLRLSRGGRLRRSRPAMLAERPDGQALTGALVEEAGQRAQRGARRTRR